MEMITVSGNEKTAKLKLAKYMSEESTQIFLSNIEEIKELLFQGDSVCKSLGISGQNKPTLSYMMFSSDYFINIKATTLLIIGIVLDLQLNFGPFLTILGAVGLNLNAITKLSQYEGEKCLVIESIKDITHKITSSILTKYKRKCANPKLKCKYYETGKCRVMIKEIEQILNDLSSKNVFRKVDSNYYLCW